MSGAKHLDLDAALDELDEQSEPLIVRLFGRDWELPGLPPAAVTIRVSKWFTEGLVDEGGRAIPGGGLTAAHYAVLLADVVPGPTLRKWEELGLSTEHMVTVLPRIMESYGERLTAGRAEGNPTAATPPPPVPPVPPPAATSSSSSPAGASSRPTSPESTDSVSLVL